LLLLLSFFLNNGCFLDSSYARVLIFTLMLLAMVVLVFFFVEMGVTVGISMRVAMGLSVGVTVGMSMVVVMVFSSKVVMTFSCMENFHLDKVKDKGNDCHN
jgi:hypothetical protein